MPGRSDRQSPRGGHPIIRPLSDYGGWLRDALTESRGRNRQDPQVPPQLRLSGLTETLDVRIQEAASHNLSHAEFLELILQDELMVRDFLHDEVLGEDDKVLARYLKPDLVIVDDMGMKQLPRRSGEVLFEIVMRRYETRSTIMTSNRPLEDWGKLIGDVPSATAILDRFLHHAEVLTFTGKSHRLRTQRDTGETTDEASKPAIPPAGSATASGAAKRSKAKLTEDEKTPAGACQS